MVKDRIQKKDDYFLPVHKSWAYGVTDLSDWASRKIPRRNTAKKLYYSL
jgi:hypothetical protein